DHIAKKEWGYSFTGDILSNSRRDTFCKDTVVLFFFPLLIFRNRVSNQDALILFQFPLRSVNGSYFSSCFYTPVKFKARFGEPETREVVGLVTKHRHAQGFKTL